MTGTLSQRAKASRHAAKPARREPLAATRGGRSYAGPLLVAPAVLYTLIFFIAPLVLTIVMSGYEYPLLGDSHYIGTANYHTAAVDQLFRDSLVFTAKYTVVVTLITLAVSFALACLLVSNAPLAKACRVAVFLPVVVGLPAASLLWLSLYNDQVGPLDALLVTFGVVRHPVQWLATPASAFWAVVALTIWKTVGFAMLIFVVGLHSIPDNVREAARIDGANATQLTRWITLPLLRRTTGMVTFLTITTSFLLFDQVFILTRGGPHNSTISVVYWIYESAFVRFKLGYASSLSVIMLVILLIVSAVQLLAFRKDES